MALHVSISAEPIFHLGPIIVNNSMLTGALVTVILSLFFIFASKKINLNSKKISRLQNILEFLVESLYNLVKDIAGEHKAGILFPLITSFFIFILFNNWFGLLPGVGTIGFYEGGESTIKETALIPKAKATEATSTSQVHEEQTGEAQTATTQHSQEKKFVPYFRAATADLNTTLALAILSVGITQYFGFKFQGSSYLSKFFNFKQGPIFTFVGLLELISEFAKVLSFAFRLFGNIFAGEVLLLVIGSLIPVIAPIPFFGMEIFVGAVQALVFAMLTLVFINMATIGHGDEH